MTSLKDRTRNAMRGAAKAALAAILSANIALAPAIASAADSPASPDVSPATAAAPTAVALQEEAVEAPSARSLVPGIPIFGTERTVEAIDITYISKADDEAGHKPTAYDPDDPDQSIAIATKEGSLRLSATIRFTDGTEEAGSDDSISWRITGFKDTEGKADTALLATLADTYPASGDAWLLARGQGNGTVDVLCFSPSYPDYAGQTFSVTLSNNGLPSSGSGAASADPLCIQAATACYVDPATDATSAKGSITQLKGAVRIDFLLKLSDGTTALAASMGLGGTHRIKATYTATGAKSTKTIAAITPDGYVCALGAGNGTVAITSDLPGFEGLDSKVIIRNNSSAADPVPVALSVLYNDNAHGNGIAYSPSKLPLIDEALGSVTFTPRITWSDGSITDAADSIYGNSIQWYIERFTDENDQPLVADWLGTLFEGTFTASKEGNGYAYIRLGIDGASMAGNPLELKVKITNNDGFGYVKSISILGTSGQDLGDGGIDTSQVGSAHTFHVKVVYSDGTEKNTAWGQTVAGLSWRTLRPLEDTAELYSHIQPDGTFSTDAGFIECRVVASIEKGGRYGQDASKELRVYDGYQTERVGYTTKLAAHIVYQSEYVKFGNAAQTAKDIEISVDDLLAKASPYTDWFTFRRNGGGWGTVYASGISITKLLSAIGIDVNDMRFMQFSDKVGYTGDSGFYSSDVILGSRYRYTNYYMHALSLDPAYLGQSSVVPMLASATYFDYGNDYNGSGYGKMERDSSLRLLMGMTGVEDGNGRRLVRCVSDVTVIVSDPPIEKPDPSGGQGAGTEGVGTGGTANTGGTGTGIGIGTGDGSGAGMDGGGGSGSGDGQAMDGSGGATGAMAAETQNGGGQSQAADDADAFEAALEALNGRSMMADDGTLLLRELTPQEVEELMPIPWMDRNNPFRGVAAAVAVAAFALGALWYERRFRAARPHSDTKGGIRYT